MANKKETKKAHRAAVRATRVTDKANRKIAKQNDGGLGKIVDSVQRHNAREDVNQAAARIVREATEK